VKVRWGNIPWCSQGKCSGEGLYELWRADRQETKWSIEVGGVRIADEEIVQYQGEDSGVGVVAEEHGVERFRIIMLGEKNDKTELRQGKVCRGSGAGKIEGRVW
jgi:hypothetical protein